MQLTSRQRVMNALRGEEVDVTPVVCPTPIVTAELQDKLGAYFPEANYEAEIMAQLALGGRTVHGYDSVTPVYGGGSQEAAAMGCPMDWGDQHNLPSVLGHIWDHPDQIQVPDDYLERKPIKACLDAIRYLRQELGDEVAIIGKAYGPWSLSYHFFGVENFLMGTVQDPGRTHAILRRLMEFTMLFAQAQIDAGADTLNMNDLITGDLVKPESYARFLLGLHQEMSSQLEAPMIFHCCGRSMDRVEHFNKSGYACYSFESANDAVEMRAKATMKLCGNVNTTQTILFGTPEDVEGEVFYALDAGLDLVSPECATPPNGKLECVTAVREARDKYFDTSWHGRARTYGIPRADAVAETMVSEETDPAMEAVASATVDEATARNLKIMYDCIVDIVPGVIVPAVEEEVAKGTSVHTILDDGLIKAMTEVGIRFGAGEIFVPEVLLSAKEMTLGLEIIRPILADTGSRPKGTVVNGTVKGDVHDIGRNVWSMMMEGAGYNMINLGVRNSIEDFFAAIEEHKPDILGMSAMLTTTMPYMKMVIDAMIAEGIRDDYIVMVGGAPLSQSYAEVIGADAYCEDAVVGVKTANQLMDKRKAAANRPGKGLPAMAGGGGK